MTPTASPQRSPSIARAIGSWAAQVFIVGWLIVGGAAICIAQDAPATAPQPSAEEVAPVVDAEPLKAAQQAKKRQVTLAGFLIVSLVSVVGLLLVLLAIWWARRLRRINDTELPKQHPGDPLWYLRKGLEDGDSTSKTDTEKSDETTHG